MKKKIYLIRHGETEWTLSGQHTSISDIPLTNNGKKQAHVLMQKLKNQHFRAVFVSPMQRAYQTCEIAGWASNAVIEPKLTEWNYGEYEGITSKDILKVKPHWNIFLHGAPKGESIADIQHRILALFQQFEAIDGDIALFSHGHFLRAFAVYFIRLTISEGRHLALSPASISILSYEQATPVISLWNDNVNLKG